MTKPLSQRGFTLIELLTVIAIIGILASIIIPTVSKVRASARKANCASNLRQLAMASQMFTNENKGALIELPFVVTNVYWFRQIYPYLKGDMVNRITPVYQCPTDTTAIEAFANNGTEWNSISFLLLKEVATWKNSSFIQNPSRSAQFIDAETPDTADYRSATKFTAKVKGGLAEWRHGNGVNIAYWDAHVAYVVDPTYEGVLNIPASN